MMGDGKPPLSPSSIAHRTSSIPGLVALLGDPVGHSRSPPLHNAAFRALGLDLVYVACRVAAGDLPAAVAGLDALGAVGANVTVPHKEAVLPLLAALSPEAAAVGAVNTLVRAPGGGWRGENTDVAGFLEPLHPHAARLTATEAVVLGAGGAARAVVFALLTSLAPARLTVVARSAARAERMLLDLAPFDANGVLSLRAPGEAHGAVRAAALVVNATPLGMDPDPATTPWPRAEDFRAGQLVYDLVYAPRETRLLREAAARGADVQGGLAMLVGQAAAAFALWTGRAMPLGVTRAAIEEPLAPDPR